MGRMAWTTVMAEALLQASDALFFRSDPVRVRNSMLRQARPNSGLRLPFGAGLPMYTSPKLATMAHSSSGGSRPSSSSRAPIRQSGRKPRAASCFALDLKSSATLHIAARHNPIDLHHID